MINQPNYLGGFLVICAFVVIIFIKRLARPSCVDPTGHIAEYRSYGKSLEEGFRADAAFLKALADKPTLREHILGYKCPGSDWCPALPEGYDPKADAREQGVGE